MFVVSKDKESIVNLDSADRIYLGDDRHTVKVIAGPMCKSYRLGFYSTEAGAMIAIEEMAKAMRAASVFDMPDDEAVDRAIRARTVERPDKFSATGKKPVRRGGS